MMKEPVVYAVGDVHGRDDLLAQLHGLIVEDRHRAYRDRDAVLLHVGDYIDRGADGAAVIDRVIDGIEGFESVSLLGNHEALMIDCLESDDPEPWSGWLRNGGTTTLRSFGVALADSATPSVLLREAVGEDRIAWLHGLRISYETVDRLFVHAGVRPGVPLNKQDDDDLIWIREPFLESDIDHGKMVIHGHTPDDEVVIRPNRICIDTGAFFSGKLTCAVCAPGESVRFLVAAGSSDTH